LAYHCCAAQIDLASTCKSGHLLRSSVLNAWLSLAPIRPPLLRLEIGEGLGEGVVPRFREAELAEEGAGAKAGAASCVLEELGEAALVTP